MTLTASQNAFEILASAEPTANPTITLLHPVLIAKVGVASYNFTQHLYLQILFLAVAVDNSFWVKGQLV